MTKNHIDALRKRSPGRPPVENPMRQITVRVTDEMVQAIDAVIAKRDYPSDRSDVIREALARGLRQM